MPLNVVFATNFSSLEYKYFRCKAGESAAISPLIRGIRVGGGGGEDDEVFFVSVLHNWNE